MSRPAPGPDGLLLPLSVVVPIRDEEATLGALLQDLDAQTRRPAEIVLVDGGSTDGTVALARAHAATDARYVVVEAGEATPGRGRNVGVGRAAHDWIALTDAGVRIDGDWLEQLWRAHLADEKARIVYGNFEFDTRSFFEECAAVAYGSAKRETPAGLLRGPAVVSCLVHREAFDAVGGFPDLRSGEDTMFVRHIADAGVPTAWAPGATIRWRLRPDLASTLERFRLYSFHNVVAGQQEHWHRPMARSYLPVAAALALAASHSRRWLPLAAAPLLARSAKRLQRHAEGRGVRWLLRPDRAAMVTWLLLASDAATTLGWWQALRQLRREPRRGGSVSGPEAGSRSTAKRSSVRSWFSA